MAAVIKGEIRAFTYVMESTMFGWYIHKRRILLLLVIFNDDYYILH